jgi:hypothetical protein
MKLALVRISDSEIVEVFPNSNPRWFDIPGIGRASPPTAGWEDYGFRILPVTDADAPEVGKQRVGPPSYSLGDDVVVETFEVEDIPPPIVLTLEEKFTLFLNNSGMTRTELRDELGIVGGTLTQASR